MTIETAEIIHKIMDDLRGDLECGSHEMNNQASEEFTRKYPHLLTRLVSLEKEANEVTP